MTYDFLAAERKKKKVLPEEGMTFGGILGKALDRAAREGEIEYDILKSIDKADEIGKGIEGEVLEKGPGYKIIKKKDEKTPIYLVALPILSDNEKKLVREIEKKAIVDIAIDPEAILDREKKKKTFLREVVQFIKNRYPDVSQEKRNSFSSLIVQDMVGYGLLDPLLSDDALEEVMLLSTGKSVYIYHRKHGMCKTNIFFETDEAAIKIIARIARSVGRRVDASSPLLDARLRDGSRVNATVPPISLGGPSLTIRKFKAEPLTILDIINFGTLVPDVAAFLWLAVEGYEVRPANILVSGGTGSGKTTTLNCLGSFVPQTERIITIEDTAELQLPVKHWIRLETRPPNVEGKGEISMDMLLRNTLRMRPDRIIVGEVRGSEANTLLTAMNTGQSGSLGTLHANNARETVTRLTSAPMNVPMVMIPALNLILMQNRLHHKGKTIRRVTEIAEVAGTGTFQLNTIFEWDPKSDVVKPTGVPIMLKRKLADLRGVDINIVEEELDRRTKVLEWMIKKDVRGVKKLGRLINEYYIDPEGFMKKVEEAAKEEVKAEKKEDKRKDLGLLGDVLGTSDIKPEKSLIVEEVLEQDKLHKLIRTKGEKNPVYQVIIPKFTKYEKELLELAEKTAVEEIEIDPATLEDKEEAKEIFTEKVQMIIEQLYFGVNPAKLKSMTQLVVLNMVGYGQLELLFEDEKLEEIMVIGSERPVYVTHTKYGTCRTNLVFESDEEIERILDKIASSVGKRIDRSVPLLDARLSDGSRSNATIPPISLDGPTLTIRKFKADPLTVVDLINFRTLTTDVSAYLWLIADGFGIKPGNILVAGGSGSGKTTTLNCLCSFVPTTDRVITIEDTAELQLPLEHWVRLETRPPSVEGEGEVTMDDLVKNTLRMRPDRVIVGEVRGPEARTLFTAMNTGHDGCMGTLHSNSAKETITRLTNPPMQVPKIMMPALDLVLMEQKIYYKGKTLRRITEIAEIAGQEGEKTALNNVYEWDAKTDTLKPTGVPSVLKTKIAKLKGIDLDGIEDEVSRRKMVLDWMVKKNINRIDKVGTVVNRYYSNVEGLMEEIHNNSLEENP
ncbi:MAG: CpaF family protein [Candidatus Hydrothermarchaeales archaeon]